MVLTESIIVLTKAIIVLSKAIMVVTKPIIVLSKEKMSCTMLRIARFTDRMAGNRAKWGKWVGG